MDIREAIKQINSNLDNLTANLKSKQMSKPGTEEYGTTLRTEIFTSDGEGPADAPNYTPPVRITSQENPDNEEAVRKQAHEANRNNQRSPPLLNKYGSRKRILVNLDDCEE